MTTVRIEQISRNEFGSELLRVAAEMSPSPVTFERVPVEQQKGEIITEIVLTLATSAAYDLLKAAVLRLVNHPGRAGGARLRVDGKEVSSEELERGSSKSEAGPKT